MFKFSKTLCILIYLIKYFNKSVCEDVTIAVNSRRSLHRVNEKFISIVVDPMILMSGLNISSQTLNLARHFSPAFIRIYGPSTMKMTFTSTDATVESEFDSRFTVSPRQWTSFNEWIINANLTPVYALSDRDRVNDAWNPKPTALPLMELTDKMNFSCYWELTNETPNKTLKQYADDVTSLHHILDAFPASRHAWGTVGGDLSRCAAAEISDITKKSLLDVENNVDAINWSPKYVKMTNFPSKVTKLFRLKYVPEIWTSAPRSSSPCSFHDALLWGRNLGEAASTGYSVIFRQPKIKEFFEITPAYWVSMLHKNLMGRTVLDIRQSNEKSNYFVYAHCSKKQNRFSRRGAVTIFVVNMGTEELNTFIKFPGIQQKNLEIQSYILTTADENSSDVYLNGQLLSLSDLRDDNTDFIPKIRRTRTKRFLALSLPGKSIGFYVLPGIRLPVCIHGEEELHLIRAEIFEDQNEKYWSVSDSNENGSELEMSNSGATDDLYRLMEEEFDTNEGYYTNADFLRMAHTRKRPSVTQAVGSDEQSSTTEANWERNELGVQVPDDVRKLIIDRAKLLEKQRKAQGMEQRRSDLKQLLLERSKIEKNKSERREAFKHGLGRSRAEIQQILAERTNEKSTQEENFTQEDETNNETDYLTNPQKYNLNKFKKRKTILPGLSQKLSAYNNNHPGSIYRKKRDLYLSRKISPQITFTTSTTDNETSKKILKDDMNFGEITFQDNNKNKKEKEYSEKKENDMFSGMSKNAYKYHLEFQSKPLKKVWFPFEEYATLYHNSLEPKGKYLNDYTAYTNSPIHSKPRKNAVIDNFSNEIECEENKLREIPQYGNKDNADELGELKTLSKQYNKLSKFKLKQQNKYRTTQNKSKEVKDKQQLKETEEKRTNKNIDIETTSRQNELSKNRTKRNLSDRLMEIRQGRENIRERIKSGYMINRRNKRRGKNTIPRMKKHVKRTKRQTNQEINGTPNETHERNDYESDYDKYTYERSMNSFTPDLGIQNVNELPVSHQDENNYNNITQKISSAQYSTDPMLGKLLKDRNTTKTKKSKAQMKILQRKLDKQRKMEERLQNYLKRIKENTHAISSEIHQFSGTNENENEMDNAISKRSKRNIRHSFLNNNVEELQIDKDILDRLNKNTDINKLDITDEDKTKEDDIYANEISKEDQMSSNYFNGLESQEVEISTIPEEEDFFNDGSDTESYLYTNDISKEGPVLPCYMKEEDDDIYKIIIPIPDKKTLSKNLTSTDESNLGNRIIFPIPEQDFDSPAGAVSKEEAEDSFADKTFYQVRTETPKVNLVDNVFQVVFNVLSDFHKRILNFIGRDIL